MADIGIITRRFLPAEGGVENFLFELIKALQTGSTFKIVAQITTNQKDYPGVDDIFARSCQAYEYHGMHIHGLSPTYLDRIRLLPCLFRLIPGLKRYFYSPLKDVAVQRFAAVFFSRMKAFFQGVSLIHSYAFDGSGLLAKKVAKAQRIPFIITPFVHAGQWGDNPLNVQTYNSADRVIALHKADAAQLRSMGVRADIIRTCPIGITPFKGNGAAFRQKYQIQGKLVLFVGRITPHKGYRELVQAVAALREEGADITCVLLGPASAPAAQWLETYQDKGIQYLGHVPAEVKRDAYYACDLFCLPSASEIMPVSILEAWYAEKPVLAGDIETLRAIVTQGKTGEFVQQDMQSLKEKLKAFLSSADGWKGLGSKGKSLVQNRYLINQVAEQLMVIYKEVLQERGARKDDQE
jgi:glycosyltransferase involved in cell wall biosynthesis